jgi:eukaryotic-like serine/threonine-protein kinase
MTTVFKQVGPYEIIRQIGHGGMAVVFLARDARSGRQIALKLVQRGSDREAQEIVESEQFGAELQKRFSERGAHVPVVYEYGVDDDSGYFFVAMEYVDGENLSELIARGAVPHARATEIAIELARFLDEAHAFQAVVNGRNLQSLLHLDLKPRNVRITSTQAVKVLDFGTAKGLSLSRKVTRNDFGSVAYLSPERLETGEVDARADLWALGVILYEMLRGIPPFQATDTRRLERLILSRRPPASLMEQVPAGLAAIVSRLLDPQAAERYASAREIRDDLERFRAGRTTTAEERGWPARAFDDAATRRTSSADDQKTRRTSIEDERTRRTVPPPIPAAVRPPQPGGITPSVPVPAALPAPPSHVREPKAPPSRFRRLFRAALLLIFLGLTANEISVSTEAGRLAQRATTYSFDQLRDAWNEYDSLSERSTLGFGTHRLLEELVDQTITLADRVFANYRSPSPTVREAQWVAARDALARALARAGDRGTLVAGHRYADGHLHRINGEAQKARDDADKGQGELSEAVVSFREAQEIRSNWPDPFLGLFRTFVAGLDDVERGSDALTQAQNLGYKVTERDEALLADGYRTHGNTMVRTARQVAGLPQERDYLSRAAEAYRFALEHYANAGSLAGVPQNIVRTQRALLQLEETLGEGLTTVPEGAQ